MIEREAIVKVYNETLGAKGVKGKLVRVSDDGFYEITLEIGGKNYTSLLPISSTVILAGEPQEELPGIQVER
jgi:hypothetical protein